MKKTKIDWLKAEQDYISDTRSSLNDIAQRYGISYSWLKKVSMEKGWNQKKQRLIEKGKNEIENNAEKSIEEQIKQHRKDATYIKDTVLSEIKSRVKNNSLENENLASLTRLLDIGMRELRELFPKNLVIEKSEPEQSNISPEIEEAMYDVFRYKITGGRMQPPIAFTGERLESWKQNTQKYVKSLRDEGKN